MPRYLGHPLPVARHQREAGLDQRGEGIDPRSSAQAEQERRLLPGAGFNLRIPQ